MVLDNHGVVSFLSPLCSSLAGQVLHQFHLISAAESNVAEVACVRRW
jgi:hypothetical protein